MTGLPDPTRLRMLLLDADGNLFPSEAPAFVASADVTNRFLGSFGVRETYTPEHLLATTTGKNFRSTAQDLAAAHGVADRLTAQVLDEWVDEEKKVVSRYLGEVLKPDPEVLEPLRKLAEHYQLAAVSSSALSRLQECFLAAGLDELIPAERRFSAEDSLPTPTSKPDPAVYLHAAGQLGVPVQECLAVEDSLPGTQSAVAAGIATVGNVQFVPEPERAERRSGLTESGAAVVIESWGELADRLLS